MEEKFKVGNILEDIVTKERFKVIEVKGKFPFAYVTLVSLKYDLRYGNFANNIVDLVLT